MRRPRIVTALAASTIALLAWLEFSCGGSSAGDARRSGAPPQVDRGPQLALPGPSTMTLAWTTDGPALGSVEYGPDATYGGRLDEISRTWEHVFPLEGLLPDTDYHYRILVGRNPVGGDHAFRTPPADPAIPFRFVVFGDAGSGSPAQSAIATQVEAASPALVLIAGDVVYPSGTPSEITAHYFEPYAGLIDHIPFYPALGNHDVLTDGGQPLLDALYLPTNDRDGTERYYSFDHGNAHFVVLDSNSDLRPGSPQHSWLDDDLARSSATWKLVTFHHPPFSSSAHGSSLDVRADIEPLLDARHVDVVFSGHDHDYERTYPIESEQVVGAEQEPDYTNPGGVVYVVTGGGGAALYTSGKSYFTAFSESVHHFVQVDIDGSTLKLKAILIGGSTLDAMSITKAP